MTAREALDRLPDELRVARGGIRIVARFHDGRLVRPARVSAFRVPASAITSIRRGGVSADLLEHVARELQMDEGDSELVVEYNQQDEGPSPRLHWIDVSWDVDESSP